jgi:hypothetical protein
MKRNKELSKGYVEVFDGVVDQEFCRSLIGKMVSYPEFVKERSTSNLITIPNLQELRVGDLIKEHEEWNVVDAKLFEVFSHGLRSYAEIYPAFPRANTVDYGYMVRKYLKDVGEYGLHIDRAGLEGLLSFTLFLNTVDNGGEVTYPEQNVTVPAVSGRMVVAPVYWTHPHKNTMPAKVDKYIVKTFLGYHLEKGGGNG